MNNEKTRKDCEKYLCSNKIYDRKTHRLKLLDRKKKVANNKFEQDTEYKILTNCLSEIDTYKTEKQCRGVGVERPRFQWPDGYEPDSPEYWQPKNKPVSPKPPLDKDFQQFSKKYGYFVVQSAPERQIALKKALLVMKPIELVKLLQSFANFQFVVLNHAKIYLYDADWVRENGQYITPPIQKPKQKRCPNGTRKNKQGDCVAKTEPKKSSPEPKPKKKRCPNGTRKNKQGDCVAKT